ncbi:MAG: glutathione S-transferase family protein [Steroidobacteraceae bacterium]
MYELNIANKNYSSWSLRPWLLLRELAIPFEERLIPFEPGSNWARFRRFAPNGKVPCLVDGATVVWDSLAIVEYLAERHPGVWPADPSARAWARCAAAEMHSGFAALRGHCTMNCALRVRLGPLPDAVARDVARVSELWTDGLARHGGPFLAGPAFTAADAFYAPVAFRIRSYGLGLADEALAYASRLLELPGMLAWDREALAEPWRDPEHDEAAVAHGTLIADLRRPA